MGTPPGRVLYYQAVPLPSRAPGPLAPAGWRPTAALIRAVVVGISALGLGLALGRADVIAMAAPLAFGLVMGLSARAPHRKLLPVATAAVSGEVLGGRIVDIAVDVREVVGAQLVSIAVPHPRGGVTGGHITIGEIAGGRAVVAGKAPDWGTVVLARPDVHACSADALWEVGPVQGQELVIPVRPVITRMDPLELPPIFGGWAGNHVSRRPGQGGDLIDLREFVPGDRLRSIHWRGYARHQRLFVRRTQSDADADFVLCVDTRAEVRPQPAPKHGWQRTKSLTSDRLRQVGWLLHEMIALPKFYSEPDPSPPSSLDMTVRTAASIAAAQLGAGDRVGVLDLSTYRRHVRMGTGTRHLERIRYQLSALDYSSSKWLVKAELWGLPAAAVVVILSPLIDDAVISAAIDCSARGHRVLLVDVLPATGLWKVAGPDADATTELDLLLAERELWQEPLRQRGIPVLSVDAGNIATALRVLRKTRRQRR